MMVLYKLNAHFVIQKQTTGHDMVVFIKVIQDAFDQYFVLLNFH